MVTYSDKVVKILDIVFGFEKDSEFRSIIHAEIAAEVDAILDDPFTLNIYDAVFDVLQKNLGNHSSTRMIADTIMVSIGKTELIPSNNPQI